MSIRAIIIDDEERGRNALASLLETYCPEVEIVDQCTNVPEGVISIRKNLPELVFLDVEMPVYNGFELLNFFSEINFEIIFVTAHSHHAITAFKVSAIDYILKPIDIDSLVHAIEKYTTKKEHAHVQQRLELLQENLKNDEFKRIALPMGEGLLFVEVSEIVLLKADGSYTEVYLTSGSKLLVSKKLKFFEDLLHNRVNFYRCHRSFLININHICKYQKGEGVIYMEGDLSVTIARDKKQAFEALIKMQGLAQ